jgi:hypothetical protein
MLSDRSRRTAGPADLWPYLDPLRGKTHVVTLTDAGAGSLGLLNFFEVPALV